MAMASRRSLSPPARRSLAPFLKRSPSMDPQHKPLLPYCTSPSQLESIVFDAEETSDSPLSELLQSRQAGPSGGMSGRTVKQYEEEMRVLKKDNFNLKLRIYFLEERMQKLGRPLGDADGAEKKLIELKVQMETLRREMQAKQALLAQAGKAIEMMEEQHKAELHKLRRELAAAAAAPKPAENSMALYADAFDLPASFLMPPPPPPPAAAPRTRPHEAELAELQQRLQDLAQQLDASQERERRLNDALDSRTPEIQIKIEELCQKDKLLEDQRKIIVEIQIKLDEKQKELEELRQSLDTQHSAVDRLEADKQQLQQRLLEADEKLEKSVKVVQTLVSRNQELAARAAGADQIGAMQHDETEHLWRELDERRRQVEQLSREKAALEARRERLPPEVGLMLARLDELAAFLAALLRRPHLIASFSAANRSSLLQLLDQSRSLDASALSASAAPDDSLLDHIHKFLDAPEHSEFIHEMESQLERTTTDLCAVSVSEELDSGKEMELARWSLEKGRTSNKPPRPPRKHELEQEEEEQPNLSESEAWSEPDRTVSLARIGLPENKTPVNQTVSSPNSSELEHSPRTPGKKASYKKLVQRLHATEQIIEALQAELSAHKALAKTEQPVGQEAALESQRARLEVVVRQSEATRQQLEAAARGEAGADAERQLAEAEGRVRQLEAELSERDGVQRHLQLVQLETQEALATMEAARAAMHDELVHTRLACQQLERRALDATGKCQRLEQASKQDMQRCQQLAKQVEEAEVQCRALTQQVQQLEAARASDSDEHSASRHTLSSPDLGIESDTGRSGGGGGGGGGGDERSRLNQENWQLKQKLAESQRIMERCLEALNKKNRDRLRVQASMEKQLLRTEEVLLKASHNLKLLPKSP
ncbi:centrosomin isoform X2 [Cloeon dipterum]|uniref:centrosomin isoform X2 n=1 Tax=Cloeon dipterum TaxID=197152 RepID=UPI00321FF0D9